MLGLPRFSLFPAGVQKALRAFWLLVTKEKRALFASLFLKHAHTKTLTLSKQRESLAVGKLGLAFFLSPFCNATWWWTTEPQILSASQIKAEGRRYFKSHTPWQRMVPFSMPETLHPGKEAWQNFISPQVSHSQCYLKKVRCFDCEWENYRKGCWGRNEIHCELDLNLRKSEYNSQWAEAFQTLRVLIPNLLSLNYVPSLLLLKHFVLSK